MGKTSRGKKGGAKKHRQHIERIKSSAGVGAPNDDNRADQAGSGHSGEGVPPTQTNEERIIILSNEANRNFAELSAILDYNAYLNKRVPHRGTVFLLQEDDGTVSDMKVKATKLGKVLSEKEFYDQAWPKAQAYFKKNIEHLTLAMQLLNETAIDLPYFYNMKINTLLRTDYELLTQVIRLQMQMLRFPMRKPSHALEPLISLCAQYIQSQPYSNKNIFEQLNHEVQEGAKKYPATLDDPKKSLAKFTAFTLSKYILQMYLSIISWGSEPKFPNETSEITYARTLTFLLLCRQKYPQELFEGDSITSEKGEMILRGYLKSRTAEIETYLHNLSKDGLRSALIAAIQDYSTLVASQEDTDSLLCADITTALKLIYAFPTVLGITPHKHLTLTGVSPDKIEWLINAPRRLSEYAQAEMNFANLLQQEQQKYIEQRLQIEQQKVAEQQRIALHINTLNRASETRAPTPDEGATSHRVSVTPLFPYLPDFERQCCVIHLDLMTLVKEVKIQVSQATHGSKPPNFLAVNRSLEEFLETIRAIPDVDANHRAQKAIFTAGCYLQFLRGHLPFLDKVESHLEVVNQYTKLALKEILALNEHTEGMSTDYVDILTSVTDEISNCENEYLRTIEKNEARRLRILERAKQSRIKRGDESGPKPRDEWHPNSRTAEIVKALKLITPPTKSTAGLFKPGTASACRLERTPVTAQIDDARCMLMDVKPTPARSLHTLRPSAWLLESEVIEVKGPEVIVLDNPDFLNIMKSLNTLHPELAHRMRLHGGAIRDFLLTPGNEPGDWDFEFFGDFRELATLLPPEYTLVNPILITDCTGQPIMTTKLPLNIDGKEVVLDITIKPCRLAELDYELSQPSNADFNPNGAYTYQQSDGKYIILNHEGSAKPKDVMQTVLAPLSTISYANLEQDPLLITRALRLQGEFHRDLSIELMAELKAIDSGFKLHNYPESVQQHFTAYLIKHRDHILAANILNELPVISDMLDDILLSEMGIKSFKSIAP
ncbi:MAG: hypothetical protein P1U34_08735 [Coxiellaceae bacterium]|nr:hypothetical protein [Coxiellaceae bacterium]